MRFEEELRYLFDNADLLAVVHHRRFAARIAAVKQEMPKLRHFLAIDDDSGEEMTNLLDAVSTNVTYFFREADHFEVFARHVNEWVAQGRRRLRVWSAGCSSGEEPYTLSIVLHEKVDLTRLTDVKILATDLCTEMLERGRRAVYPATRLKDLSRFLLSKYFQRNRDLKNPLYRVKESLRRMVVFRRFNFMDMRIRFLL